MPDSTKTEAELVAEARALAKLWTLNDLKFYLALWRSHPPNANLDGAASFEVQRAKIRDLLADLAE